MTRGGIQTLFGYPYSGWQLDFSNNLTFQFGQVTDRTSITGMYSGTVNLPITYQTINITVVANGRNQRDYVVIGRTDIETFSYEVYDRAENGATWALICWISCGY